MSQTRYEVLGKIAEGGLGAVYKAYDRNLRREVALKRVRANTPEEADQQAEQLFQEARTLSTLQHPHIVTIFDVGRDEEGAYIVMELLKGETLEDIIERGALNENDFRDLALQSLEGMISAHSTGLIHLDIKPQNFMVIWLPSGKFQIKILDFGLSQISHTPLIQETDEDGSILGSIFFMAPEQFERSPVDIRTDLYSLGCVYYFALTQNYPFQGETAPEVMSSHLYHSFIPLAQLRPDLPKFIPQWVEWLMNRDPNQRPSSVAEAFEVFAAGQFPQSHNPLPPPNYIPAPDLSGPSSEPSLFSPTSSQPLRSAPRRPKPTSSQLLGSKKVPKPVAKPINISAAAAPKHLAQPRKPLPKWLTLWLPISIAAILLLFFGFNTLRQSQMRNRFDALAKMQDPVGSLKDIPTLLHFLENPSTSENAGQILGKLQNIDAANPQLINHLNQNLPPHAVRHLATAIAQRKLTDALPNLLRKLNSTIDTPTRITLWDSIGKLATHQNLPELLNQLSNDDTEELRTAERALIRTARTEPDLTKRSEPLLSVVKANTLSPDQQATVIRTLTHLGSPHALSEITNALSSNDPKIRTAAAVGLSNWPTSTPILPLLDFVLKEKNPFIRGNAFDSIGSLASLAGNLPQEEIAQALITAYPKTKDNREQTSILEALAKVVSPTSQTFFEQLAKQEPRRRALADRALKSLKTAQDKAITINDTPTTLPAANAQLSIGPLIVQNDTIINWYGTNDTVNWLIKLDSPGTYHLKLSQSSDSKQPARYLVTFGIERFPKTVENTLSHTAFKDIDIGSATFTKPGYYRLWLRPQSIPKGQTLMRIKNATITKQ